PVAGDGSRGPLARSAARPFAPRRARLLRRAAPPPGGRLAARARRASPRVGERPRAPRRGVPGRLRARGALLPPRRARARDGSVSAAPRGPTGRRLVAPRQKLPAREPRGSPIHGVGLRGPMSDALPLDAPEAALALPAERPLPGMLALARTVLADKGLHHAVDAQGAGPALL